MSNGESHKKAAKLVKQLEHNYERDPAYSVREIKKRKRARAILNAEPETQAAVVQYVVETIGRLGAARPKNNQEWVMKKGVPWATFDLIGDLLRKDLPLSQKDLAQMFEQLAGIGLMSSIQLKCPEALVTLLEKVAERERLEAPLRKAAARFGNAVVGKKLTPVAARLWKKYEWGPDAADSKLSARIERALARPLMLG